MERTGAGMLSLKRSVGNAGGSQPFRRERAMEEGAVLTVEDPKLGSPGFIHRTTVGYCGILEWRLE